MESSWTNATLQSARQVFLLKSENTFLIKCSTYHAHLVIRNEIIKKERKKKRKANNYVILCVFQKSRLWLWNWSMQTRTYMPCVLIEMTKLVLRNGKKDWTEDKHKAQPFSLYFWYKFHLMLFQNFHYSEVKGCAQYHNIRRTFYRSRISQTAMNQLRKPAF